MENWHIFVFSFNRSLFLKNCLDSIKKCCSGIDVTVIDDNSDDLETKKVLAKVESGYGFNLVNNDPEDMLEKRLGGLYSNMNLALRVAKGKNKKYVIFIQDDMQFVRKLKREDFNLIESVFSRFSDVQQVQACFLKRLQGDEYYSRLSVVNELPYYFFDSDADDLSAFSDVGVFCTSRLEEKNVKFVAGERANNKLAVRNKMRMVQLQVPFMMWLPYSTTYRSKKLKLKHRVVESIAGCGFYPIDVMNDAACAELVENKAGKFPIAESWLRVKGLENTSTWSFSTGVINLFARGGFRRKLALLLWKL